jgi:DNA-binding PadR family transcriptional regulator
MIMAFPSKQNALKLQRIIEETTGREVSLKELYSIWHYLQKVLLCSGLWRDSREPTYSSAQESLFN